MIVSHAHSMGQERQKTRQLAIEAVSKALAIISGDSAHDLFTCPFDGGGTPEDTPARNRRGVKGIGDHKR